MTDPYAQQEYNPYARHDEQYVDYQTPTFGNVGATQIKVRRCVLVPSGEYGDQYRRPWVTSYNRDNANMIHEAVASTYHDHKTRVAAGQLPADAVYEITPEMMAGVSSSFILPSSTAERKANINAYGGWGTQTARFMLNVSIQRADQVQPMEYILIGYTNFMGLTAQGNVAHDMEFNINTMFEVRSVRQRNAYGVETSVRQLVRTNQILVDDRYTGDVDSAQSIRMRPFELISVMQAQQIPQLHNANVSFTDARIVNSTVPVYSNQHHTNPNNYMASVLGGLVSGKTMAAVTGRTGPAHPFHQAAQNVADFSTMRDPFLLAIKNYNDGALTNKFTFRDLLRLDPNAERDDICFVQWREAPQRAGLAVPGENMHVNDGRTSGWHGNDRSTQVATMITNILPSLMADLALQSVTLYAANIQAGNPVCWATNPMGILGDVDMSPQALVLQRQFQQQLVDAVSYNGQIRYEISVQADLAGEIWIKVQLEGDHAYDYVAPAYASSQMSPVMTTRRSTLDNLAESFHTLQQETMPVVHKPVSHSIGFFNTTTGNRY